MPAPIAKSVKTNTRKRFLTLAAIMRSIIFCLLATRRRRLEIVQCALHFGFGVYEKVRARDHAFAFRETALYFVVIADLLPQSDDTRFELAAAFVDKGDFTRPCWHDRAGRDDEPFAHVHAKLDVGIHPRLQFEIWIRDIDAHLRGPLGLIEERADDRYLPFEFIVRI